MPSCTYVGPRKARRVPIPSVGDEMRALRKLQREQEPKSPFVFTSERNSPFSTAALLAWWSALVSRPS